MNRPASMRLSRDILDQAAAIAQEHGLALPVDGIRIAVFQWTGLREVHQELAQVRERVARLETGGGGSPSSPS